jgi:hypothetical protein
MPSITLSIPEFIPQFRLALAEASAFRGLCHANGEVVQRFS